MESYITTVLVDYKLKIRNDAKRQASRQSDTQGCK